jgi:hypothetical protein
MNRGAALLVFGVFLSLALAGCLGGGGEADGGPDDPAAPSKPVDQDAAKGQILGIVVTDESQPIRGVEIATTPSEYKATSDEGGHFVIPNVEPGTYTLLANRLGFQSYATKVEVVAGQAVEKTIQLTALAIKESYHETFPFRGVHQCTFSIVVWVSPCDYPYTAVYYTALGQGVNLSQYGAPAEPLANKWRYNTKLDNFTSGIVSELSWQYTSAASQRMMLVVSCAKYDPVLDTCSGWSKDAEGTSPVRLAWTLPKGQDLFMTRVYLPFFDVQVAIDQKFDVYHTVFWGDEPPEKFSALPDA